MTFRKLDLFQFSDEEVESALEDGRSPDLVILNVVYHSRDSLKLIYIYTQYEPGKYHSFRKLSQCFFQTEHHAMKAYWAMDV
jgi:hypothetical protein